MPCCRTRLWYLCAAISSYNLLYAGHFDFIIKVIQMNKYRHVAMPKKNIGTGSSGVGHFFILFQRLISDKVFYALRRMDLVTMNMVSHRRRKLSYPTLPGSWAHNTTLSRFGKLGRRNLQGPTCIVSNAQKWAGARSRLVLRRQIL